MKSKQKTICTRVYSFCKNVNGEQKILETKTLTFTQSHSMIIRSSKLENLIPSLNLVAGYHDLNLDSFEEFEFAMDALKHCVTWN
jgi:hypothetical protein